jgi:hypothetical protein
MYKFILLVDPETCRYYSVNLSNYEIHIEDIRDPEMRRSMDEKAKLAVDQLKQIVSWEKMKKI